MFKSPALGRMIAFGAGAASSVKQLLGRVDPLGNLSEPVNSGPRKRQSESTSLRRKIHGNVLEHSDLRAPTRSGLLKFLSVSESNPIWGTLQVITRPL